MAKGQKGMLTLPTENWTAEIFSPPYMFAGGSKDRQTRIKRIDPVSPGGYTASKDIGGKTYFLLHSNEEYSVQFDELPSSCREPWHCADGSACSEKADEPVCSDGSVCSDGRASLSLIKLPSATHGWDSGQKFVDLPFKELADESTRISFRSPDMEKSNIPPGYYMMFYVDCQGRPSHAQMVRFDDAAQAP